MRLCINACGTTDGSAVRKIAAPGTRTGGASIRPGRKVSMRIPSLRISSRSNSRPRRQVRIIVNSTSPSATGNHAPCSSLAPLAMTKHRSITRNTTHSATMPCRARGHSARATSASSSVSISIVPDTEMP
ncbi:hypothetical protein D3C71_1743380 [compost metagenome]